ncbi:omega-6 fatty acid desaturase, chloroplastic-like isoform X2 [Malania oleifera]|uniref:omega-6 fatty acid desaturase, chloroplastic-like isoform X2 n=1 Tax=Malania oleifera TaxID=397392 RepID=UPI0025AE7126|nr:omega-6 fatty acid desaturase, chloroplastic-like isoform X2 [Malania oleifera]
MGLHFCSTSLLMGSHQYPIQNHRFMFQNSPYTCHPKWKGLPQRQVRHQGCLIPLKRINHVRAMAICHTQTLTDNTADYRKNLAQSYGYTQIGEPLPRNVTLRSIVETIPKEMYEIDEAKAWKGVLLSVSSYALGLFMTSQAPWYLLPLAWAWTGTAVSGFFCIGHDCGHKSFSRNKLLEDIVGTLAFLPLIYPYEGWRFEHDRHHAKTNMLHEDTGWHPIWKEDFESSPLLRKAMIYGYGLLRPWMTIAHWLMWHFDEKKFRPNERKRVKISVGCVYAFMAVGWPLLVYGTGPVGWFNYWFMPWLVFHFWMSTTTMIHHTAPHISFKPAEEWNAAQSQLGETVHCDFPPWIENLLHHINVHIPHHLAPRIPHYNLRAAHKSLRANWGKGLQGVEPRSSTEGLRRSC